MTGVFLVGSVSADRLGEVLPRDFLLRIGADGSSTPAALGKTRGIALIRDVFGMIRNRAS